jgi:ABC-type lipoprotein export system ATPase subunit
VSDDRALAVEAIDVYKSYDRGLVHALDGLTLSVAAREYVAITGPSGCGKSTFLQILAALDRPDKGCLRAFGVDLATLRDPTSYRRNEVGLVFQLHDLLPHLNALDNVEIAMLGTHTHRKDQRARAHELRDSVDLTGREQRRSARALGRRTSTRSDRACARQPPAPPPGGRADGQPRLPLGHARARPDGRAARPRAGDRGGRHAR